ncbi:MAG: hypothetical protein JSW28_01535 [Thermoplasmata archaeon]|nr:MAG: hypothetical protein JSW28_01535 [Thermoplasmata archaeon]
MKNQAEEEIFECVRAYVRQEQEERGREQPVELGEISAKLQIPEDDILGALLSRIHSGELAGTDILLTFKD